ncbi:uncharacterized protein LOC101850063 [Aplysia californica]|uniref:Uncharacterized protein LOC101850063 n=1 Tax=Aplysia californica TaxID=6500 RepID=A0ABM1AG63_APLCA|nr:uncharacterized protein LOC101850063 [Aplysia californica]
MDFNENSLGRSPHAVHNADVFPSFTFSSSHSSRCGTATGSSNMSSQQSPVSMTTGTLGVLDETSENMSGYSSTPANMLSPRPLPPIPQQQMPPHMVHMQAGQYGHSAYLYNQQMQGNTDMTPSMQQQLRPQYPQAYTGFNSCRMGAMQAQRMISMQNFNPDSFNMPLDGMPQPGFTDTTSLPTLESLPVPAEPGMQQYLQLTAIDRCNSRTSVYADGTT